MISHHLMENLCTSHANKTGAIQVEGHGGVRGGRGRRRGRGRAGHRVRRGGREGILDGGRRGAASSDVGVKGPTGG